MLSTLFSGPDDLIIIVVALVVIFGGSQLPKLARNAGDAMREFRKAHSEASAVDGSVGGAPSAPVAGQALSMQAGGATKAALSPASEERVTLSRSELDALLAERESRARSERPDQKS